VKTNSFLGKKITSTSLSSEKKYPNLSFYISCSLSSNRRKNCTKYFLRFHILEWLPLYKKNVYCWSDAQANKGITRGN